MSVQYEVKHSFIQFHVTSQYPVLTKWIHVSFRMPFSMFIFCVQACVRRDKEELCQAHCVTAALFSINRIL